jgi:hypothetical protein
LLIDAIGERRLVSVESAFRRRSAELYSAVPQICNLQRQEDPKALDDRTNSRMQFCDTADQKSALPSLWRVIPPKILFDQDPDGT